MACLYKQKTPYQTIDLETRGDELVLWLDGYIQFGTNTERAYHELLCSLPVSLARSPRRVLIMGGGDGLGVREVLRFPEVESAVLAELDPYVLDLASREPLVTPNEGSLKSPRLHVVVGDARDYLRMCPPESFDVIVSDFPAATSRELAQLYSSKFYDTALSRLRPGGVIGTQISESRKAAFETANYLRGHLGHAIAFVAKLGTEEGMRRDTYFQGYAFASSDPLRFRRTPPGPVLQRLFGGLSERLGLGSIMMEIDAISGDIWVRREL